MARPTLTLEEAEKLVHFDIPATPDVWMPGWWKLSVAGVLMALVPDVGTHLFMRAVGLYRSWLPKELQADPRYAPNNAN